jgi:DNA-binding transcriptional LysR family regulator
MRSLNFDQLRALTEVITQGSFTAAAKRLHLSQPAVSVQIRDLELRLGVRLVERLGKRAYPTAAGRDLIEHARRIAHESELAIASMRRHRDGWLGRIRIGASTTALIYHLPPVLRRIRERHPNIELVVTTGTTTGVIERMMENEIDLGIVSLPVDDKAIEVIPLREEKLVAILHTDVTDAPETVKAEYLRGHPLILEYARAHVRRLIIDWLSFDGTPPRPAMELDNLEAVKRMVAAGLGVSIVPEAAVASQESARRLVVRPLEPELVRKLALVQRRDKPAEAALGYVREMLMGLRRT